jgi:hypothetical protein
MPFKACWSLALAACVALPAESQLREVRPAHTAFAFGWSDVTGYGTAVALLERLPRAPLALGLAAGSGGVGAHLQLHLPDPFMPRRPADHEPVIYLSAGLTRLFGRDGPGEADVEWAAMLGSELWPDARAGFFTDCGFGVVGTIGGTTPAHHYGGPTLRLLLGWAF